MRIVGRVTRAPRIETQQLFVHCIAFTSTTIVAAVTQSISVEPNAIQSQ